MSSISAKDKREIVVRIGEWHRRLQISENLRRTLRQCGGADLLAQYDTLSSSLYGQARGDVDFQVFESGLRRCRNQVLDRGQAADRFVPALNPTI